MLKSGLIFGIIAFVLVLGSATIISPLCAPCLGVILGLFAGYVAGEYDRPANVNECIRKGAISGVIAGGLGFLGGMIGSLINSAVLNPSNLNSIYQTLGLPNPNYNQATIWAYQLVGGLSIGLFNIVWMAVLGLAGGALWFQVIGKNRTGTMLPPQAPIPPAV